MLSRVLSIPRGQRRASSQPRLGPASAARLEVTPTLSLCRGDRPSDRPARHHDATRHSRSGLDRAAVCHRYAGLRARRPASGRRQPRSLLLDLHRQGRQAARRPDWRRGRSARADLHSRWTPGAARAAHQPAPVRQRARRRPGTLTCRLLEDPEGIREAGAPDHAVEPSHAAPLVCHPLARAGR